MDFPVSFTQCASDVYLYKKLIRRAVALTFLFAAGIGVQGVSAASVRNDSLSPGSLRPDFLGSVALRVQRTPLDGAWAQSTAPLHGLGAGRAGALLASISTKAPREKIETVNSWVNRHIRFSSDMALYGRADFWATADQTLNRMSGDCEDIAILKRQLLAPAGIPTSRMFLMITRDLVRRADHAVLVVETSEGPMLLDNSTDQLLDASKSNAYQPIFTFGANGKWLHGYARDRSIAATSFGRE